MTWVIVATGLILILCGYILFAPFFLELDTREGLLQVRWHTLAKAKLKVTDRALIVEIKVAWWHKGIDLLQPRQHQKKSIVKKKSRKKISLQQVKAMLTSFKINRLDITLSFDDMPTNGILYPLALLLARRSGKNININFRGENDTVLEIENNLFRLAKAYVLSKPNNNIKTRT